MGHAVNGQVNKAPIVCFNLESGVEIPGLTIGSFFTPAKRSDHSVLSRS